MTSYKVLIIGSGGRECAVAKKLSKSSRCEVFYYGTSQNPIMDRYGKLVEIGSLSDIDRIVNLLDGYDLVFVGPEKPLNDGIVDALSSIGTFCIGPTKKLAQIETSKIFTRSLLQKIGLGDKSVNYWKFMPGDTSYRELINSNLNIVIKADGLHGGKGVKVFGDHLHNAEDCKKYCHDIHNNNEPFLIEEKIVGDEFSLISLCDGKSIVHTIPVKDFKRAYDGDTGPNTGSMGSITEYGNTLSFLTEKDIMECQKINENVFNGLQTECGEEYRGVLYGSFMKTTSGIKVFEYNARFGDPECINILELMKTDFLDVLLAIKEQTLSTINLSFREDASVFKYIVPQGYPTNPVKNKKIRIPKDLVDSIIGASLSRSINLGNHAQCEYIELGSRTMGYIITGKTIEECAHQCNLLCNSVSGPVFYRKDIGKMSKYKLSGVNIEEGNRTVRKIKTYVESTFNNNVVSKFGDFSGMFKLSGYNNPILVSTTDGVGTKSILVLEKYGPEIGYQMLGKDIVNHCVDDILVKGAKRLFFLDYFAASKINSEHVKFFVKGISEACRDAGCVLIGGETAEMPDIYNTGHSDIVGTMIGVVEEDKIIDGKRDIEVGDIVIGFHSSGPHTNGYSLIRKILKEHESTNGEIDKATQNNLCASHKSYLSIYTYLEDNNIKIKGMVHITGGGFEDNIPRVLPKNMSINYNTWEFDPIFKFIQTIGKISNSEMKKVFNCGIGMVMVLDSENYSKLEDLTNTLSFTVLGHVE